MCSKKRFRSEEAAERVLLKIRIRRVLGKNERRREARTYACRICKGWHLTSKAD